MNLIVYNACKAIKLLIITWVHICISFNKLIWLIQKNEKIDILSLLFMPFTGNKSPGAKKGSDEWWCDNFTNIFWVKRTFICFQNITLWGKEAIDQMLPAFWSNIWKVHDQLKYSSHYISSHPYRCSTFLGLFDVSNEVRMSRICF